MQRVDDEDIRKPGLREIFSVSEFCKRYRLDSKEERRLKVLLGDFATQHELLMNAKRDPQFRW
ncbi:hypothetical protein J5J10_10275 [Ciceribacter sp. L1K23]|uniref:hypothetical protein n=1 Tax=unclassified Ciceribacter TaxID=2628820 RepID=UPI001ABDC25A|nr:MULTISPECIES: hypothetical protein [unclassified Ciceribacter]MBO3759785.1 hypothetical protein [Ciceribacter sp. L1K22]MBR0556062.1 hypothetical protein [Ciceribacter sp. L1K23]